MGDQNGLTARFVNTVADEGKYYDKFGLFLRVSNTGAKKWVQRYSFKGIRREMGLGSAKLIPLKQVREIALQNQMTLYSGEDPLQNKHLTTSVPTFEESARIVYEQKRPSWKNAKHAAQFISSLEVYVFPYIGEMQVNNINSQHILKILEPIWLTKEETARRVRSRLSSVFSWTIANQWRADDPASTTIMSALPRQSKKIKHRKSMHYNLVSEFIDKMKQSNAAPITKLALEFLILTATRSGELRDAPWSEIDGNLWTIPAERMKAGVTHKIPLSKRCLEILQEARTLSLGSKYIFCGFKKDRPLSENTFAKLIAELNFDIQVHGFRTSFRTWTQERTNYPREVAEAALAHSLSDKAEAAYARSDLLDKRRDMMETWSRYISEKNAEIIILRG